MKMRGMYVSSRLRLRMSDARAFPIYDIIDYFTLTDPTFNIGHNVH